MQLGNRGGSAGNRRKRAATNGCLDGVFLPCSFSKAPTKPGIIHASPTSQIPSAIPSSNRNDMCQMQYRPSQSTFGLEEIERKNENENRRLQPPQELSATAITTGCDIHTTNHKLLNSGNDFPRARTNACRTGAGACKRDRGRVRRADGTMIED